MAMPSIKALQELGEFKQNFRWDVDFTKVEEAVKAAAGNAKSIYGQNLKPADLSILCESIEMPKRTLQKGEVLLRGVKVLQAGYVDFENTMTITFADNVRNVVMDLIDAWQDACYNTADEKASAAENYGLGSGGQAGLVYKADLEIHRFNMQKVKIYSIKVVGCFCETFDPGGTLDGQSSEISKPSMTISFDNYYRIPIVGP